MATQTTTTKLLLFHKTCLLFMMAQGPKTLKSKIIIMLRWQKSLVQVDAGMENILIFSKIWDIFDTYYFTRRACYLWGPRVHGPL